MIIQRKLIARPWNQAADHSRQNVQSEVTNRKVMVLLCRVVVLRNYVDVVRTSTSRMMSKHVPVQNKWKLCLFAVQKHRFPIFEITSIECTSCNTKT